MESQENDCDKNCLTDKECTVQGVEDQKEISKPDGLSSCHAIFFHVFYIFCFISGQFIFTEEQLKESKIKKVFSGLGLVLFFSQVCIYFGHVGTAIAVEGCRIGNVSFTTNMNSTDLNESNCLLPQEHWKFSTAITLGTIAAFLSYGSITFYILIPAVECCTCCICKCKDRKKAFQNLSPFGDDESSKLSDKEARYFFANYIILIGLFVCSFVSSIVYADSVYNHDYCSINALNVARIALHLTSQFCAIQSCFIFSNVVYKVTKKLDRLVTVMDEVNQDRAELNDKSGKLGLLINMSDDHTEEIDHIKKLLQSEVDSDDHSIDPIKKMLQSDKDEVDLGRGRYYWLKKIDQDFSTTVKPTLRLFGYWFVFHWIMYALTTILLSAVIVEIIIDIVGYDIQSVDKLIPDTDAEIKASYILYVVFFTLVHAYLFLYPCFRAAAIANARAKLINTISEKQWEHVSPSLQSNFVQYLTSQNFAFQVPFLFGNISFGFNWVYVSFFIAICGAYLKF